MITYLDAVNFIKEEFTKLKPAVETVSLHHSLFRTSAQDIFTDTDFPPFDYSSMDGFGILYSEKAVEWNITGEVAAGNFHNLILDKRSAVSIMTGAKIPEKADAVIPVEDVIRSGKKISLREGVVLRKGMNIRKKSAECKVNTKVISSGTQITASHMPILSGCGLTLVKVFKKLTIGILATGDELIDFSKIPEDDKIRATNNETLFEQVTQVQQHPEMLGIVKDEKEVIKYKLEKIFFEESSPDILITTGGVSVGDRDYIPEVLEELGVKIYFWKVNIKPGKPLLFGTLKKESQTIQIFGLPGNPVSAFVSFRIFIQPVIAKLYNQKSIDVIPAEIISDITKSDNKRHFVSGIISYNKKEMNFIAAPVENQSSGNMFGLGKANCLIVIPENQKNLTKGSIAECILI